MKTMHLTLKEKAVTLFFAIVILGWIWDEIEFNEEHTQEQILVKEHYRQFSEFYYDYVKRHKSMKEFDH